MKHFVTPLTAAVAVLALTISFAMAQTAANPPGAPSTSADPGLTPVPSPGASRPRVEQVIDGPVKDVDPVAKTVDVGWFLGLFSTTLEMTNDTRIAVDGANGSLDMIREGDRVKASYEAKEGKNIAKAIDVSQPDRSAMPGRAPAESPQRSAEPPLGGRPKTP
jgi:hypothetical protein